MKTCYVLIFCLFIVLPFSLFPIESSVSDVASDPAFLNPSGFHIVDLTHPFNEDTIYWPTSPSDFELEVLHHGSTDGGYFYASNRLCTPEHGGTHMDAPLHFAKDGFDVAEVPLERLVGSAVVIDITIEAKSNADYRLTIGDINDFESKYGRIPEDAMVLLYTGWAARWPDAKSYLGDDTPGDASRLHFPSYSEAAARFLIEQRGIATLGVDTASIDYGQSGDFKVHRIAGAANVPGLENLTNLDKLPATGAWVIALPMKISEGSGAPLRAIALVPGG